MWEFAMSHPYIFLQIVFWLCCFTCSAIIGVASAINKTNSNMSNVNKKSKDDKERKEDE